MPKYRVEANMSGKGVYFLVLAVGKMSPTGLCVNYRAERGSFPAVPVKTDNRKDVSIFKYNGYDVGEQHTLRLYKDDKI